MTSNYTQMINRFLETTHKPYLLNFDNEAKPIRTNPIRGQWCRSIPNIEKTKPPI